MRKRLLAVGAIAFSVLISATARAQLSTAAYPSKPMRLIITVPPGGSVDPTARLMAAKVSQRVGQQMLVDNRPGGATA